MDNRGKITSRFAAAPIIRYSSTDTTSPQPVVAKIIAEAEKESSE
jgi:hypothetical protein